MAEPMSRPCPSHSSSMRLRSTTEPSICTVLISSLNVTQMGNDEAWQRKEVKQAKSIISATTAIILAPCTPATAPASAPPARQGRSSSPCRIERLQLAPKGTATRRDQLEGLHFPRVCIDEDNNIVERFVTDDDHKSGRLYDRLYRIEVPRIVPCMENVRSRCVYDVLRDQIRDRSMLDDFLDSDDWGLGVGNLEVSREECMVMHFAENSSPYRDARGARGAGELG